MDGIGTMEADGDLRNAGFTPESTPMSPERR